MTHYLLAVSQRVGTPDICSRPRRSRAARVRQYSISLKFPNIRRWRADFVILMTHPTEWMNSTLVARSLSKCESAFTHSRSRKHQVAALWEISVRQNVCVWIACKRAAPSYAHIFMLCKYFWILSLPMKSHTPFTLAVYIFKNARLYRNKCIIIKIINFILLFYSRRGEACGSSWEEMNLDLTLSDWALCATGMSNLMSSLSNVNSCQIHRLFIRVNKGL